MSVVKTNPGHSRSVFMDTTIPRRPRLVIEMSPEQRESVENALEALSRTKKSVSVQAIVLDSLRVAAEQEYFWTREWQAKERAADQAIAAGRVRTFNTIDKMLDFLDAK